MLEICPPGMTVPLDPGALTMTEIIRLQTVLSQELTRRFERTAALEFTDTVECGWLGSWRWSSSLPAPPSEKRPTAPCTARARRNRWQALLSSGRPELGWPVYWGPSDRINPASCSTSAGFRSVSGERTGPASCPTIFAPALTMLTAYPGTRLRSAR